MKSQFFLLSLFVLPGLVSCKKDTSEPFCNSGLEPVHTYIDQYAVATSPYLAAYPGSWWVFSTGDSLLCTESKLQLVFLEGVDSSACESYYTIHQFFGPRFGGSIIMNPDFIGGMINGEYGVIANQVTNTIEGNGRQIINTAYIDEMNESSWIVHEENGATYTRTTQRKLNAFHASFTLPNGDVYENVAEIQQNFDYVPDPPEAGFSDSTLFYYAREVGLIMTDHFDFETTDIHLVDHFIAPH